MLPLYIYVSGMPVYFRGWNGKYELINNEYHLINHRYYGIDIIHIKIVYNDQEWIFITDHDIQLCGPNAKSPLGLWKNKILITEKEDLIFWNQSDLILAILVSFSMICLIGYINNYKTLIP